jgi:hypothetical protein
VRRLGRIGRRRTAAGLLLALLFRAGAASAQPPANPALFGTGNDVLALLGLLLLSCPLVWVGLNRLGSYLYGKTNNPSWERFWRDRLVVVGALIWFVGVIVVWALL